MDGKKERALAGLLSEMLNAAIRSHNRQEAVRIADAIVMLFGNCLQ